ncbi:MAG: hypothetical protein AB7F88_04640 [Pyrinomonadaceae bacterium]
MNSNIKVAALIACLLASAGCPTSPIANGPGNGRAADERSPRPPEKTSAPDNTDQPVGSLATPTEAYRTSFAIRQRKDGQALKRVLSKEIIEFFTEMGKASGKSLDQMLQEIAEKPQAATPEVRNEKITGDRAILEYKDEKGEWKEMDFQKEGSEWKLTLPRAEPSAPTANK